MNPMLFALIRHVVQPGGRRLQCERWFFYGKQCFVWEAK